VFAGLFVALSCAMLVMVACGARTGLGLVATVDAGHCTTPNTLMATVHTCDAGGSTTLSGTVYDPAGRNPIFNVVVYVPGTSLEPLPSGASCDSCSALYTGNPVVTALTDSTGRFTLQNVPDGPNIPLVIQVGKWRRQFTIANVTPCTDNPLPDKSLTLPKNHREGDIPNIAVSTGGADTLECLLTRIGLDASEYGGGADGPGRIHIFQGGEGPPPPTQLTPLCGSNTQARRHATPATSPPGPSSAAALWDSLSDIMRFDMVLLSCEGAETWGMNQQVLFDYTAAGGRVFASHYHYSWFNTGPFSRSNLATWSLGATPLEPVSCNDAGTIGGNIVTSLGNGQPFPGGRAMRDWLTTVGATDDAGVVPLANARHNVDVNAQNTSVPWVLAGPDSDYATSDTTSASGNGATLYMSFNTPLDALPQNQCGQVIFSDLHVSASANDDYTLPIPEECKSVELAPEEKILEFMLFDLSSCVMPRGLPPAPPPTCTGL
jgi:hypothetical protein